MTIFSKHFFPALTCAALLFDASAALGQDADASAGVAEGLMAMDGSSAAGTEAPTGWHVCDIVRTGAGWGNHYVALTCPTGPFTNKWHIMNTAQKDAMLATALAAVTSGNEVQVYIQAASSGYNQIRALYLHK